MRKILITGSAGFIGASLTSRLLNQGDEVIGIDNHNDYYDPNLKESRLSQFSNHPNYKHFRINLEDRLLMKDLLGSNKFDIVVNLAAQAGVRYSIENPFAYISSNLIGFCNLIEESAQSGVKHFIYASSSSVYGLNHNMPFSTNDNVDNPASLYAATKKSNELIAHAYSNIYNLSTTGLRFFTVYGPWGRPDMALFKFTKSILENKKIQLFNYGNHSRDFTYIDDIIDATLCVLDDNNFQTQENKIDLIDRASVPWRVFNIGGDKPIKLMRYVSILEKVLGRKAKTDLLPLQPGDVLDTAADMSEFKKKFNFKAKVDIETGIKNYVEWYKDYYRK